MTLRNPIVEVVNSSLNAKTYFWEFENQKTSNLINPTYQFVRTGLYMVKLIAIHENGCQDTTVQQVTVGEITDFYVPNIFTPNGDGVNDILTPEGIAPFAEYEFSIFDRWGGLLFLSKDSSAGWTGDQYNTSGSADGVYIYQIRFTTEEGLKKIVKGSVTLIR